MFLKRLINVSAEVARAVKNGEPVVALESAIITHGMPWPKNYEVAMKVESIIRQRVSQMNIIKFVKLQACPFITECSSCHDRYPRR